MGVAPCYKKESIMVNPVSRERDGRFIPFDKWREYETEKRKLQYQNLSPDEYEAAIRELCERMEQQ